MTRHLQADCLEPESAPEPYARQSSKDYLSYPIPVSALILKPTIMSVNVTSLHCIGPYFYTGPPSFASSSISYFFRCLSLPFPSFTMLLTISFYCQLCLSSSHSHIPPTRVVATIFLDWIGMNYETSVQSIHFILIPFFQSHRCEKLVFTCKYCLPDFYSGSV